MDLSESGDLCEISIPKERVTYVSGLNGLWEKIESLPCEVVCFTRNLVVLSCGTPKTAMATLYFVASSKRSFGFDCRKRRNARKFRALLQLAGKFNIRHMRMEELNSVICEGSRSPQRDNHTLSMQSCVPYLNGTVLFI